MCLQTSPHVVDRVQENAAHPIEVSRAPLRYLHEVVYEDVGVSHRPPFPFAGPPDGATAVRNKGGCVEFQISLPLSIGVCWVGSSCRSRLSSELRSLPQDAVALPPRMCQATNGVYRVRCGFPRTFE
jgi:hypothetical protein